LLFFVLNQLCEFFCGFEKDDDDDNNDEENNEIDMNNKQGKFTE